MDFFHASLHILIANVYIIFIIIYNFQGKGISIH